MGTMVKVFDVKSNSGRVFKFNPGVVAKQAVDMVTERWPVDDFSDYGLFYPAPEDSADHTRHNSNPLLKTNPLGFWLAVSRSIDSFGFTERDCLEFRRKRRPVKVGFLDGTYKVMLLNETLPVGDLLREIARKVNLVTPLGFALAEESPSKTALRWLDTTRSLREQAVAEQHSVIFRMRFFFEDHPPSPKDTVALHFYFLEAREGVLKGTIPCTEESAFELAALQLYGERGAFDDRRKSAPQLDLDTYLPARVRGQEGVLDKLLKAYQSLSGVSTASDAEHRYVTICQTFPCFGLALFPLSEVGATKPFLLGVGRGGLCKLNPEAMTVECTFPFAHIYRWCVKGTSFLVDFGDYASEHGYPVLGLDAGTLGEEISHTMTEYVSFLTSP